MTLDDISKLSDDELRVKVAELSSIIEQDVCPSCALGRGQGHASFCTHVLNFPGSRDAMAEAEGTLHHAEIDDYVEHVGALVRNYWISQGKDVTNFNQHSVVFAHMGATARQRAIAFIATKEGVR